MIAGRLLVAYRYFHEHGTCRVGFHGVDALALAKAEAWAREDDSVEIVVEEEQERYEDVYGEPPPEGVDFFWIAVKVDGEHLASCGMVDDTNGYHRIVKAQLCSEALGILADRQVKAEAAVFTQGG